MKPTTPQPEGPVTIRMSQALQQQLDDCAHLTGMKVTDLMRLCMRIGMEHFRRIDYNEARCIVEAVEKSTSPSLQRALLRIVLPLRLSRIGGANCGWNMRTLMRKNRGRQPSGGAALRASLTHSYRRPRRGGAGSEARL